MKLRKKYSLNFATRYENVVAISQILEKFHSENRCAALCCQRCTCSKTKYEPTILAFKETPENSKLYRRDGVVHITLQLNFATITLS